MALTVTSQLMKNVRDYFLSVGEVGLKSVFRGRPSSLPALPCARLHHEDRAIGLEYNLYNWDTSVVLQLMSETQDELDELEFKLLDQLKKDSQDITETLSDEIVGVYNFEIGGIREDIFVESPEEEGRFFVVRSVVFGVSYYSIGE